LCPPPPFALERVEAIDAQQLTNRLPKPRPNGRTALTRTPLEFTGRLAALLLAADQLQRPLRSRFRHRLISSINRGTGASFSYGVIAAS